MPNSSAVVVGYFKDLHKLFNNNNSSSSSSSARKTSSITMMLMMTILVMTILTNFSGVVVVECSSLIRVEVNWNNITANELKALDSSIFSTVSSENIASIPSSSCVGFRTEQITKLSQDGCVGFAPDCFANIPADSFVGFTSPCILNIRTDTMAVLSFNQLQNIQPGSLTGLTASQLSSINSATCAAFSSSQISGLTSTVMFDTCIGFRKECFFNIPLNSFSGFQYPCFSKVPASILVFFDSTRFAKLSNDLVSYIGPEIFHLFDGEVCAGFDSGKLSTLPYQTCIFSESCFAHMPPSAMFGMNALCMESVPNPSLRGLTAELIRNIPPRSLTLISSSQLAQIYKYRRRELFDGLTLEQAQAINFLIIAQIKLMFSTYQLQSANNLPTNIQQLNWFQLASTSAVFTSKITSDQIPMIPTYSFSGFLEVQVSQMESNVFANASDGQVSGFDCSSIYGLRADQISQMTSHFICALQNPSSFSNCVRPSSIGGVTISQLEDGVNCGRVFTMNCEQFHSLTKQQYTFLSSFNQTQAISAKCGHIYVSPIPNPSGQPSHSGSSSIFLSMTSLYLLFAAFILTTMTRFY